MTHPYYPMAIDLLNKVKAWRDCEGNGGFPPDVREGIDALLAAHELVTQGTFAEQVQKSKAHTDLAETIGKMVNAVGYSAEYARQWPDEMASVTFKRWFDERMAAAWQQGYTDRREERKYGGPTPNPYKKD